MAGRAGVKPEEETLCSQTAFRLYLMHVSENNAAQLRRMTTDQSAAIYLPRRAHVSTCCAEGVIIEANCNTFAATFLQRDER